MYIFSASAPPEDHILIAQLQIQKNNNPHTLGCLSYIGKIKMVTVHTLSNQKQSL